MWAAGQPAFTTALGLSFYVANLIKLVLYLSKHELEINKYSFLFPFLFYSFTVIFNSKYRRLVVIEIQIRNFTLLLQFISFMNKNTNMIAKGSSEVSNQTIFDVCLFYTYESKIEQFSAVFFYHF